MDSGTLQGLATLAALLAFAAVVAWAWSARRKDRFEAASRMPLEEDRGTNEDA